MNESIKYATLNSLLGIAIGFHITNWNETYYLFILVLPIAFFLTSILLWKVFVDGTILKIEARKSRVLFVGFLTGFISHPLSFLIQDIVANIVYWLPFIDSSDLIEQPIKFADTLKGMVVFPVFSLIMYGWITIPSAMIFGYLIEKFPSKKTAIK